MSVIFMLCVFFLSSYIFGSWGFVQQLVDRLGLSLNLLSPNYASNPAGATGFGYPDSSISAAKQQDTTHLEGQSVVNKVDIQLV
jgi:hypothetical protein